jgi:hypothetical protein
LQISVLKTGAKRDVTFDIATSAPVLSARAAQILRSLGDEDIELISARVEGEADEYFVMNVLSLVKCLDEEKTQLVEKWTTDSYRPDRTGEYKRLWGIVIDPAPAIGRKFFRLWGSRQHIITSRAVKEIFEREGMTGVRFSDVCSPKRSLEEELKAKSRYQKFYERLLEPLVAVYGPVQRISSAVVGFDGGGPVKTCILGANAEEQTAAYVTCELAVRENQKPSSLGRFELFTVCDDTQWARAVLTRAAHMSMNEVLDADHTVNIGAMPDLPGTLEGVVLEAFTRMRVDGQEHAIFRCIGITRSEMEFARREGVSNLQRRLIDAGVYTVTRCRRTSII